MESAYYARHYLGQQFWFKTKDGYEGTDCIDSVSDNGNSIYGLDNELFFFNDSIVDFKMILKHCTDMPKDERAEYKALCHMIRGDKKRNLLWIADTPASLMYAVNKGYDMFDLIENGLAIDAENFKP